MFVDGSLHFVNNYTSCAMLVWIAESMFQASLSAKQRRIVALNYLLKILQGVWTNILCNALLYILLQIMAPECRTVVLFEMFLPTIKWLTDRHSSKTFSPVSFAVV